MELTAKEATILTLLSARPSTPLFDRLVEKLDKPSVKAVAEKIRQRGATEEHALETDAVTVRR